jgi:uncharacterized membrane protein
MEQILETAKQYFEYGIQWAIMLCEVIGVIMIILTAIRGVIAWVRKNSKARLIAAEGIAIALTFKMGGEVLRTVIVREWQELLILGAIVLLRTIMAFIIHFEIRSERQILSGKPEEPEEAAEQKKKRKLFKMH